MRVAVQYALVAIGILAFAGAACVHIETFLAVRLLPEGREQLLGLGAVVLWVAAVLSIRSGAQLREAKSWQHFSIEGAPGWLRYALFTVLGYGVINFILVPIKRRGDIGDVERALLYLRLWSGHALFMYLAPVVAVWSALRLEQREAGDAAAGA
jgi:hypothetical protein